ncbi:MAG: transposase [Bacteroidia bacterium]
MQPKKEAPSSEAVITSLKQMIDFFTQQIKDIEKGIQALMDENEQMKKDYDYIRSIPSIGPVAATTILAETQGFYHFRNANNWSVMPDMMSSSDNLVRA